MLKYKETDYYKNKIIGFNKNMKNLWRFINTYTGNKNINDMKIKNLVYKENSANSDSEIAEVLNRYYVDVAVDLARVVKHGKNADGNNVQQNYHDSFIQNSLFLESVSLNELETIITQLKDNKKTCDVYSVKTFKQIVPVIKNYLLIIINESFHLEEVPKIYKRCLILPIFKGGGRDKIENYRPIAISSICIKIIEKLIYNRCITFLEKYSLLQNIQFGFRKNHSTIHAICNLVNRLYKIGSSNENKVGIGVFIDYSKAFNCVNHDILLNKMAMYGMRGKINNWFRSYLADREQMVLYKNELSNTCTINIGVPQGSILGPLLYLLYVNDIRGSSLDNNYSDRLTLYADDLNVLVTSINANEAISEAHKIVSEIKMWTMKNELTINEQKTYYMFFHRHRKKQNNRSADSPITANAMINLAGYQLHKTSSINFLGICIDEKLKFDEHVKKLAMKMNTFFPIIYRLRDILDTQGKYILYYAYIYSRIQYGIIVYGSTTKSLLNKIQIIQNRTIRTLFRIPRMVTNASMYKQLNLLQLNEIYKLNLAIMGYLVYHDSISSSLKSQFVKRIDVNKRNSRFASNFDIKYNTTNFANRDINNQVARIWNKIPIGIRDVKMQQFKTSMKKLILEGKL